MAAILIVEDDQSLAWAEARILRQAGHTPIHAPDARTALQEAADRPDLILLDLGLPDLPGEEVLRRLKSRPETAQIPVLVITGYPEAAAQLRAAEEASRVDILLKPFASTRLSQMVESILSESPAQDAEEGSPLLHRQQGLIRRLIEQGPDSLVFHVYRRLRADRVRTKNAVSAEALTWTEIAEWAKREGLLDPEQASLLRRPWRAGPEGGRTGTA
jgi:DNA-binding response OmpR family regulator